VHVTQSLNGHLDRPTGGLAAHACLVGLCCLHVTASTMLLTYSPPPFCCVSVNLYGLLFVRSALLAPSSFCFEKEARLNLKRGRQAMQGRPLPERNGLRTLDETAWRVCM